MADFRWEGSTPTDIRWEGSSINELRYEGETIWPGGSTGGTIDTMNAGNLSSYSKISDSGLETWNHTDSVANTSADPIGGGPGYPNTWTSSDADTVVSTPSEFYNALTNAASGEVIFVAGDIDISTYDSDSGIVCNADNVVICGDRGVNGSSGPTIYSDSIHNRYIQLGGVGARFSGLEFRGPQYTDWSRDIDQENGDWQTERKPFHHKGLHLNGDGIQVDNCHIWGFGYSCVSVAAADAHVHHNNLHHGTSDGWGYAIETSDLNALIEYNRFSHCRHMITDTGVGSYEVRHNLLEEPGASNVIDMHNPGGGEWTDVHHNTVVANDADIDGRPEEWTSAHTQSGNMSGYIQRDVPTDLAEIHDNWMWNPLGVYSQDSPRSSSYDQEAIDQAWIDATPPSPLTWESVTFSNNHFDAQTVPSSSVMANDTRRCRPASDQCLAYYGSRKTLGYLSTSGLSNYPSPGDTWRFFGRWEGVQYNRGLVQVFFGLQSESSVQNCYEIEFGADYIALDRDVDGTDTRLLELNYVMEAGIPYEIVVDWPSDPANNGITLTVNNVYSDTQVASGTATADNTYTSGGFGFYGNSWAGFLLDDARIL